MRSVPCIVTSLLGRALPVILVSAGLSCGLCVTARAYPIDGFIDNWSIDTSDLEHSCRMALRNVSKDQGVPSRCPYALPDNANRTDILSAHDNDVFGEGQRRHPVTPQGARARKLNKIILIFASFTGIMIPFARRRYCAAKRVFDIVGSIVILSLLSPLMLVIALLIKIDSPGSVFYQQTRVGVNRRKQRQALSDAQERRGTGHFGKPFTIYKFRTMRADAESQTGPVWAKENDQRVTRIGHFLRKTRLDELPQFLNVLKGDMCIIGPRPERPVFINQLNDRLPGYARRLQIKPGITGLAQVRYQYAASIEDAKIKLRYDLVYIKKMCFMLDVGILLNTFNVVLLAKGAR